MELEVCGVLSLQLRGYTKIIDIFEEQKTCVIKREPQGDGDVFFVGYKLKEQE